MSIIKISSIQTPESSGFYFCHIEQKYKIFSEWVVMKWENETKTWWLNDKQIHPDKWTIYPPPQEFGLV